MALDEFIVKLTFDSEGNPETATYWDQEGCGHEHPFNIETGSMVTTAEMVQYHLAHYLKSHHQFPKKRCPMTMTGVDPDTKAPLNFRCILEPHRAGSRHQLEQY